MTSDKLKRIIDRCGTDQQKSAIILPYLYEFIPDGQYTLDEQLAFIICAIPLVDHFPENLIIKQLIDGPNDPRPSTAPDTHRNILKALKAKHPESVKLLANFYRPIQQVPSSIKSNDDWCAMCAILRMMDIVPGDWTTSQDSDKINQAVQVFINGPRPNY